MSFHMIWIWMNVTLWTNPQPLMSHFSTAVLISSVHLRGARWLVQRVLTALLIGPTGSHGAADWLTLICCWNSRDVVNCCNLSPWFCNTAMTENNTVLRFWVCVSDTIWILTPGQMTLKYSLVSNSIYCCSLWHHHNVLLFMSLLPTYIIWNTCEIWEIFYYYYY